MKTITVTSQNELNYGAVLQAYALQQQLFKLHVDDELINLKNSSPKFFWKFTRDRPLVSTTYNNLMNLLYIIPKIKMVWKFNNFVKNNIKTTHHYNTIAEVKKKPPLANIYITGSDQLFNTQRGVNDINFLRFGDESIKRISFATSMGEKNVKEEYKNDFISAVKKYEYLSVREGYLTEYISSLTGKKCEENIDPTFLLDKDEWFNLTGSAIIKGKYILCYVLIYNPILNQAIAKLKKETGLKVVVLSANPRNLIKGDVVIRNAGINDFLTLYKNAEYIVTTTFHGTCFSIIFEKNFFTFIRPGIETRINNIINKLNLEERMVLDLSQISCAEIDYSNVREIILKERNKSVDYLRRALNLDNEQN